MFGLAVPPRIRRGHRRIDEQLRGNRYAHTLKLTATARAGDDLREGALTCAGCGARYPIPRMLPGDMMREASETAERFGYEWTRFGEIRPQYAAQFQGWIAPVEPAAFTGRVVLDAGCGKGRHLRLAARYGAREVIGVDLGPAVEVAARNTADLDNVHVIQGDLTRPPLRPASVDVIYSIGVLHHLGAPVTGFRALAALLAPGGFSSPGSMPARGMAGFSHCSNHCGESPAGHRSAS